MTSNIGEACRSVVIYLCVHLVITHGPQHYATHRGCRLLDTTLDA